MLAGFPYRIVWVATPRSRDRSRYFLYEVYFRNQIIAGGAGAVNDNRSIESGGNERFAPVLHTSLWIIQNLPA